MKKRLRSRDPNVEKWLIREDDKLYYHVRTAKQPVIDQNTRIRNAGLMRRGARFKALDEYAEFTAQFQFPTQTDYQVAKRRYPDEFAALEEGGDAAVRAGERLAILMPEYVTMVKPSGRVAVGQPEKRL